MNIWCWQRRAGNRLLPVRHADGNLLRANSINVTDPTGKEIVVFMIKKFLHKITDTENVYPWINKEIAYGFLYVGFILITAYFTRIYVSNKSLTVTILLTILFCMIYMLVNHRYLKHDIQINRIILFESLLLTTLGSILIIWILLWYVIKFLVRKFLHTATCIWCLQA